MPGGLFSSLTQRVLACWRLKIAMSVGLATFFCVGYFLIGNYPLLAVHELTPTPIDLWTGFHPYGWIWIYQSIYIVINVIPWFATERDQLVRYAKGFVILSFVSFAIFIVWPIRAPRPAVTEPSGMYWLLIQYDVTLNSLPSLHAGLLAYTLCFARRIFRSSMPHLVAITLLLWAGLILYATLAIKEHYFIDIVCGTALGVLVDSLVWQQRPRVIRHPEPLLERS